MNDLCVDLGYKSLNKFGEQLCGDMIQVVKDDDTTNSGSGRRFGKWCQGQYFIHPYLKDYFNDDCSAYGY